MNETLQDTVKKARVTVIDETYTPGNGERVGCSLHPAVCYRLWDKYYLRDEHFVNRGDFFHDTTFASVMVINKIESPRDYRCLLEKALDFV